MIMSPAFPRRYAIPEPYEKLKALTRGQAVNQKSMQEFVSKLELPVSHAFRGYSFKTDFVRERCCW